MRTFGGKKTFPVKITVVEVTQGGGLQNLNICAKPTLNVFIFPVSVLLCISILKYIVWIYNLKKPCNITKPLHFCFPLNKSAKVCREKNNFSFLGVNTDNVYNPVKEHGKDSSGLVINFSINMCCANLKLNHKYVLYMQIKVWKPLQYHLELSYWGRLWQASKLVRAWCLTSEGHCCTYGMSTPAGPPTLRYIPQLKLLCEGGGESS